MTQTVVLEGPVSTALESDLRDWTRRHGIAVWLDLDGHYSAFVDRLIAARTTGTLPYEVRAYRGSHLALMTSLEGLAGGADKVPLVVHMPGFTEETIRDTPLYELYAAGTRYRKALDTLITEAATGRVRPDRIAAFTEQPGVTLDGADAWLASRLSGGDDGIAAQLRAMQPVAMFDDLLTGGYVAGRISQAEDARALWEQLAVWTGLPSDWRETALPPSLPRAEDIAFAAASWVLCVEYVDDLKRIPVNRHLTGARHLPRPIIDTCRGIAAHLRGERHAGFYERTADETEALLADEVEAAPLWTRRIGISSSGARRSCTRSFRDSRRCAHTSTKCDGGGGRGRTDGRATSTRSVSCMVSSQTPPASSGQSSTRWSSR